MVIVYKFVVVTAPAGLCLSVCVFVCVAQSAKKQKASDYVH